MKTLLSRLLILCLVGSLLALSSCEKDEPLVAADAAVSEQPGEPVEITGAEVIRIVEQVHGDVSKLTFEEKLELFSQIKVAEQNRAVRNGLEKATAEASQDVYSTFLTIFFIPYQGAPQSQYITFYDTTPPIIGLPPANDTRSLTRFRCPGFFQITCIANAFKNNTIISGQSATRSNYPSCGSARQFKGFAEATITTFGSATTQASVDCTRRFCAIDEVAEVQ